MIIQLALMLAFFGKDTATCVEVQHRQVCAENAEMGDPLVIYLHGYGGHGGDDALKLAGNRDNFYAAPDALPNGGGQNEWRKQDVEFLSELIDALVTATNADKSRVYLAGFSLGGFLALDYACAHPERVRAVVSVAGTRFAPAAPCAKGSVSVLEIHGDHDQTVKPEGGVGKRLGVPYLSAREAVTLAAAAASCTIPLGPAGQNRLKGLRNSATGCSKGAKIEWWMLAGGDHFPTVLVGPSIWEFLRTAP